MKAQPNTSGRRTSLQISVDQKWYSAILKMLPDFNAWIDAQIKKNVINRICSDNFLVPDLTIADLTEQEKSAIYDKIRDYNRITGMPRPTPEQVEPYLIDCRNVDFLQCLEFAIAHIWAKECFKDTPDVLRHATFYLEMWNL